MIKTIIEKRNYPRLNGYFLVKYKVITTHQENRPLTLASTKDISGGGVRLHIKSYIPEATTLELYINYPGFDKPVQVLARVVWIRKIRKVDMYDVGIQFIDAEDSISKAIANEVKDVLDRMAGK